jgi:hypothetical protein
MGRPASEGAARTVGVVERWVIPVHFSGRRKRDEQLEPRKRVDGSNGWQKERLALAVGGGAAQFERET